MSGPDAGGDVRALPTIPDDDADFTPDLARKIIAKYQQLIAKPDAANASVEARLREVLDDMLGAFAEGVCWSAEQRAAYEKAARTARPLQKNAYSAKLTALSAGGDEATKSEGGCCKGLAPIADCRCEQERKAAGYPPYHRAAPAAVDVELDRLRNVAWAAQGLLNADTYVTDIPRMDAVAQATIKLQQALGTWQMHHTASDAGRAK
jgi:hypothetical protein